MKDNDWVSFLLRKGIDIRRCTTRGQVVVIITSRKKRIVLQRRQGKPGFCRVPKRGEEKLLEKLRQENPRIEGITL